MIKLSVKGIEAKLERVSNEEEKTKEEILVLWMIFFFEKKKRIKKMDIEFSIALQSISCILLLLLLILLLFCHLFVHIDDIIVLVINVELIVNLEVMIIVFYKKIKTCKVVAQSHIAFVSILITIK